jgi:hypothetical protein
LFEPRIVLRGIDGRRKRQQARFRQTPSGAARPMAAFL